MKKILLFAALLFSMFSANAQNASLTVNTTSPCWWYSFIMHGYDGVCGTDYIAYSYDIPPLTSVTWSDPCQFEAGAPGIPAVGFSTYTTGVTSVCPFSSISATWQWGYVEYRRLWKPCGPCTPSCPSCGVPGFATVGESFTIACASSSGTGACTASADWTPANNGTTAFQNVTINFY